MFLKKLIWTLANMDKKILENTDIKPKDLFIKIRMLLTGKNFGPSMNQLLLCLQKMKS